VSTQQDTAISEKDVAVWFEKIQRTHRHVSYHFTARIEVQNGVDVTSRFQIAARMDSQTCEKRL
jgi:hypothetical protein